MSTTSITLQNQKLTLELITANIKATYYAATQYPSLYESGLNWYSEANAKIAKIASRNRVSIECAAGIVSALSVRNTWDNNLLDAELLLKCVASGKTASEFKVQTFNSGKNKGIAIALGQAPLQVLTSNKQRDFYLNLVNPLHPSVVVIDGHAVNIGLSRLASLDQSPGLSNSSYKFFSEAYRQACYQINADSREGDILPSQLQAITWTYYRVIRGIDKTIVIDSE